MYTPASGDEKVPISTALQADAQGRSAPSELEPTRPDGSTRGVRAYVEVATTVIGFPAPPVRVHLKLMRERSGFPRLMLWTQGATEQMILDWLRPFGPTLSRPVPNQVRNIMMVSCSEPDPRWLDFMERCRLDGVILEPSGTARLRVEGPRNDVALLFNEGAMVVEDAAVKARNERSDPVRLVKPTEPDPFSARPRPSEARVSDWSDPTHGERILEELEAGLARAAGAGRQGQSQEGPEVPMLTDRQRDALVVAVAQGYYDVPRRTSQKQLAAMLGVSAASLSELLRRAEGTVVQAYVRARFGADGSADM